MKAKLVVRDVENREGWNQLWLWLLEPPDHPPDGEVKGADPLPHDSAPISDSPLKGVPSDSDSNPNSTMVQGKLLGATSRSDL